MSREPEVLAFFSAIATWIVIAETHVAFADYRPAIAALDNAVVLCEENPGYAALITSDTGPSLVKFIRKCVKNVQGGNQNYYKVADLMRRLDALPEWGPH